MAKLTISDVSNIFTAAATLNANNDLIVEAIENTLSRDGTSPNEMNADLDMNDNRIYNLPEPQSPTEPLRLADAPSATVINEVYQEVVALAEQVAEDAAAVEAASDILVGASVTGGGLATGGGDLVDGPQVITVTKADAATVATGSSDTTAVTPLGLRTEGEHLLIEPSWTSGRKSELRKLHRDWCRLDQDPNFDPTGTTNMNSILTAAMTAYKKVIIPANCTVAASSFTMVQNDQHIIGEGPSSVIRMPNGGNDNLFNASSKSRIRVENLTLDGNKANQSAGNGSNISGCTDIRFYGVRVVNMFGNGLIFQTSCVDVMVDGCYFSDLGSHGISLSELNGAIIRGNRIIDARLAGVNLGAVGNFTIADNVITRNSVYGASGSGAGGIRTTNTSTVGTISGNTISLYDRGIMLITGAQKTAVTGNSILEPWYDGIFIEGASPLVTLDIAVNGNVIHDPNRSNAGSYDGIRIAGDVGAVITMGNQIRDERGAPQMQYGIRDTSTGAGSNVGRSTTVNFIGGAAVAAVN